MANTRKGKQNLHQRTKIRGTLQNVWQSFNGLQLNTGTKVISKKG